MHLTRDHLPTRSLENRRGRVAACQPTGWKSSGHPGHSRIHPVVPSKSLQASKHVVLTCVWEQPCARGAQHLPRTHRGPNLPRRARLCAHSARHSNINLFCCPASAPRVPSGSGLIQVLLPPRAPRAHPGANRSACHRLIGTTCALLYLPRRQMRRLPSARLLATAAAATAAAGVQVTRPIASTAALALALARLLVCKIATLLGCSRRALLAIG